MPPWIELEGEWIHITTHRDKNGKSQELTEADKAAIQDVIRCLRNHKAKKVKHIRLGDDHEKN